MRYLYSVICVVFLASCTSNTIFEKPKDLIPKDTMRLLLQDMMIASSAKFIKNTSNQKNIDYMPLVHQKYNIDSTRFYASNFYYVSKLDEYKALLEDAKKGLDAKKTVLEKLKRTQDSIKRDSVTKAKKQQLKLDSIRAITTKN